MGSDYTPQPQQPAQRPLQGPEGSASPLCQIPLIDPSVIGKESSPLTLVPKASTTCIDNLESLQPLCVNSSAPAQLAHTSSQLASLPLQQCVPTFNDQEHVCDADVVNFTRLTLPPLFDPPTGEQPAETVPATEATARVYIKLFRNVMNAVEIKQKIVSGDQAVPLCTLVNASTIIHPFQIQMACTKSILHQSQGIMRTRALHTEILFNLSPNNSISEAMRIFGLTEQTTDVVCIMVREGDLDMADELAVDTLIHGKPAPLGCLREVANVDTIRKIYKTADSSAGASSDDAASLTALVVGAMALKGYI